jgi:hypothetical protein
MTNECGEGHEGTGSGAEFKGFLASLGMTRGAG